MDGSATAASSPATCRAPRQIAESLRKHTRNTMVRSGKPLRKSAREKFGRREFPPAPSIVPFLKPSCSLCFPFLPRQQPQQFRFELREFHRRRRAPRMYHDVPSGRNLLPVQSQNFSHPAPNPVAHNRRPQSFFHAHPEAPALKPVFARKNYEIPARTPPPFAIHRVKFRAPHQPRFARPITPPLATRISDVLPFDRRVHRHSSILLVIAPSLPALPCFSWKALRESVASHASGGRLKPPPSRPHLIKCSVRRSELQLRQKALEDRG